MGKDTSIEWTTRILPDGRVISGHTFNAWEGCQEVGPPCDGCYAKRRNMRFHGGENWGPGAPRRLRSDDYWKQPLRWDRDAAALGVMVLVFGGSLCDPFDRDAPADQRTRLWDLVKATPHLFWMFVTKRIGNATKHPPGEPFDDGADPMLPADWGGGYPNVMLLSTVATQEEAERDVPKLLSTPARWRGVSCEPMLGGIDLRELEINGDAVLDALAPGSPMDHWRAEWDPAVTGTTIEDAIEGFEDWGFTYPPSEKSLPKLDVVIAGGASDQVDYDPPPMLAAWPRGLRDQCVEASVAFHFKQWGAWLPGHQYTEEHLDRDPGDYSRFDRRDWVDDSFVEGDQLDPGSDEAVFRVGKKHSGRLLDGKIWHEFPDIDAARAA